VGAVEQTQRAEARGRHAEECRVLVAVALAARVVARVASERGLERWRHVCVSEGLDHGAFEGHRVARHRGGTRIVAVGPLAVEHAERARDARSDHLRDGLLRDVRSDVRLRHGELGCAHHAAPSAVREQLALDAGRLRRSERAFLDEPLEQMCRVEVGLGKDDVAIDDHELGARRLRPSHRKLERAGALGANEQEERARQVRLNGSLGVEPTSHHTRRSTGFAHRPLRVTGQRSQRRVGSPRSTSQTR
jgi:hypothetical protein